jgi:hypothetical protein
MAAGGKGQPSATEDFRHGQTASEQILVANCLALLETPELMRLTSTKESGFCEFATSRHDLLSPPRMKMCYNSGCAAGPEVVFDTLGSLAPTEQKFTINSKSM